MNFINNPDTGVQQMNFASIAKGRNKTPNAGARKSNITLESNSFLGFNPAELTPIHRRAKLAND